MWRTHTKYVANGLRLRGEHSAKCQQTIREICNEHPVRRRGESSCPYPYVIKNVHFHNQIRISTLPNTYIHFTEYVHSHHYTRISTSSNTCFRFTAHAYPHHRTHISATLFVGEYGYAGTINRTFAAANGWQHATSPLLYYNKLSP